MIFHFCNFLLTCNQKWDILSIVWDSANKLTYCIGPENVSSVNLYKYWSKMQLKSVAIDSLVQLVIPGTIMKAIVIFSLIVAVVAAGNWNSNDRNNRENLTERDGKHQKFIIDLLRHLQQDIHHKDFMQYSQTIRLDNKGDYKVDLYLNRCVSLRNVSLQSREIGLEQSLLLGVSVPKWMVRGSRQTFLIVPWTQHHHHKSIVRFLRHNEWLEHLRHEPHLGSS